MNVPSEHIHCPVCATPMERFNIARRTGIVRGIRCPTCKTSSFLSRAASERLQTRSNESGQAVSAQATPASPTPIDSHVPGPSPSERVPKTLFERLLESLSEGS